jgi:hypothetical protein
VEHALRRKLRGDIEAAVGCLDHEGDDSESYKFGGRRRCTIGGDDDAYRHPGLHIYDVGYFIGVWNFARYPSVLLLRIRLATRLDYLEASLFLQRLAWRWGYVLFFFLVLGGGRVSSFCLLSSRYPCTTWFTQTWLERHKSSSFVCHEQLYCM